MDDGRLFRSPLYPDQPAPFQIRQCPPLRLSTDSVVPQHTVGQIEWFAVVLPVQVDQIAGNQTGGAGGRERVPAKIRKRREQFIKVPMWWIEKLGETRRIGAQRLDVDRVVAVGHLSDVHAASTLMRPQDRDVSEGE